MTSTNSVAHFEVQAEERNTQLNEMAETIQEHPFHVNGSDSNLNHGLFKNVTDSRQTCSLRLSHYRLPQITV
jgi:hypothetical protein